MEIKTESPIVTEIKKNEYYEIRYGELERDSFTKVNIDFYETHFLNYSKTCTCTAPSITNKDGYFTVSISYDSTKTGTINQEVNINTTEGKVKIALKGKII